MTKKVLIVAVLIVIVGTGLVAYRKLDGHDEIQFKTAPVVRGDLLVTISATGTVEPEEVVDVGAQVAGKIKAFGEDPHKRGATIDYGSQVEEGTILAHIDDALYLADAASNTAQLEQAKANVLRAQADLESKTASVQQADAGVELALLTFNHLKEIPEDSASMLEMQTADATLKQAHAALSTAKANVAVAESTVEQSKKMVMQQEADLSRAKTNLDYCTIRSPVKGAIIDRRVNIGQTVVSSLNAPSLFLIAKDLKRMQVWASVNEADIGNIHPGQKATFTVDAYPGRTFTGVVGKIRLNATMTQNVVTYTVEITTDNSDGALLPYLTANVQFEVKQLQNVLKVPNVALRWIPAPQRIAPGSREESPRKSADGGRAPKSAARIQRLVWIPEGSFAKSIAVTIGPSDGAQTQIESNQLKDGDEVIVGETAPGETNASTTNPFAPQMFGGRRQQS